MQIAKEAWRGFASGFSRIPQDEIEMAGARGSRGDDDDEDDEEDAREDHPASDGRDSPPASRRRGGEGPHRVERGWGAGGWYSLNSLVTPVWADGRGCIRGGDV